MTMKLFGAALIILACGGYGFMMANAHRKEVKALQNIITTISYIKCELQFRNTALPELCSRAAKVTQGCISRFFQSLAAELEAQICPDTNECLLNALSRHPDIPPSSTEAIVNMGTTIGVFDLTGQLDGLNRVLLQSEEALSKLTKQQDIRIRSYQTLGLCAGAALAILLV